MKLLHTSDWHLGKRLFKLDRAPEHELFLSWLLKTLIEEKVDVLLISGDIFDTPTPPHQSLEMFYQFLHRVSEETKTETLIIAGNHDSGLLLEAPKELLKIHRVTVWGKLSENPSDHWKTVNGIDICAIPFFRSYELLRDGEGDALTQLNKYLTHDGKGPKLLMLHHLAGIFEASGSEQVISLSGVDSIPTETLKTFDYVALGHIHKPQRIGENIYYSGSPIPLRFSETLGKSVVLIEEKSGKLESKICPIPKFRDLHIVKTNFQDFEKKLSELQKTSDLTPMVEVQINLDSPKTGLIDQIKTILINKEMELLSYIPSYEGAEKKERKSENLFKLSPLELFQEFYSAKFPEKDGPPDDLIKDFSELLEKVKHAPPQT